MKRKWIRKPIQGQLFEPNRRGFADEAEIWSLHLAAKNRVPVWIQVDSADSAGGNLQGRKCSSNLLLIGICLLEPGWRNWQTQRTQNPILRRLIFDKPLKKGKLLTSGFREPNKLHKYYIVRTFCPSHNLRGHPKPAIKGHFKSGH